MAVMRIFPERHALRDERDCCNSKPGAFRLAIETGADGPPGREATRTRPGVTEALVASRKNPSAFVSVGTPASSAQGMTSRMSMRRNSRIMARAQIEELLAYVGAGGGGKLNLSLGLASPGSFAARSKYSGKLQPKGSRARSAGLAGRLSVRRSGRPVSSARERRDR